MGCRSKSSRGSFSNYGKKVVHLAAPGVHVLTTIINSTPPYAEKSGTSFAAPHVSGALALMMSRFPDATNDKLIARLLATTDPMPGDKETISGGQLNLARALKKDWLNTGPFSIWH